MAIRRALHARGLRYRVNVRDLPGRPDIVFSRARIAVQVDGCFWHGCPEHCVAPKANAAWWQDKLDANRARDARNDATLQATGWYVMRFWEHDDPTAVAEVIEAAWRSRTGRTQHHAVCEPHSSRNGHV